MNNNFINNVVVKRMPMHSTFTEKNHLTAMLASKPFVLDTVMTQIFSTQMYSDNTMMSTLGNLGATFDTGGKMSWEYKIAGNAERPLISLGKTRDAAFKYGYQGEEFPLWLEDNLWRAGDEIHPGDPEYTVRIMRNPVKQGKGYYYYVKPLNKPYIHESFLTKGREWVKSTGSRYEEGAEQAGSTTYRNYFNATGKLSFFRKHYKITGHAHHDVLAIKLMDANKKMHTSWIKYAHAEFLRQWYKELEISCIYGAEPMHRIEGSTGRPIFAGPGQEEIIKKYGQRYGYNKLTYSLIREAISAIDYGRLLPGTNNRGTLIGFAGEQAMEDFHNAMMEYQAKINFVQIADGTSIRKVNSPYHNNAYAAGFQVVRYDMPNGRSVELRHTPAYDDISVHKNIDPDTGRPYESSKITFMDLSKGKDSNVRLVTNSKDTAMGWTSGTSTPNGRPQNNLMSHTGDYYTMIVQASKGYHMTDPTRVLQLYKNKPALV